MRRFMRLFLLYSLSCFVVGASCLSATLRPSKLQALQEKKVSQISWLTQERRWTQLRRHIQRRLILKSPLYLKLLYEAAQQAAIHHQEVEVDLYTSLILRYTDRNLCAMVVDNPSLKLLGIDQHSLLDSVYAMRLQTATHYTCAFAKRRNLDNLATYALLLDPSGSVALNPFLGYHPQGRKNFFIQTIEKAISIGSLLHREFYQGIPTYQLLDRALEITLSLSELNHPIAKMSTLQAARILALQHKYDASLEKVASLLAHCEDNALRNQALLTALAVVALQAKQQHGDPLLLTQARTLLTSLIEQKMDDHVVNSMSLMIEAMEESCAQALAHTATIFTRHGKKEAARLYLKNLFMLYPKTEVSKRLRQKYPELLPKIALL